MVDRRQVNGRYDPWSFTTKSVEYARNNDVHTIRRILQSDAFREAPASRKFILLKAIVKDFGCVRSICGLLQRHVFCSRSTNGGSSTAMRPDMVDSQGSSLAHWAAQNSDPTPVLKILRDLGCSLKAVNKAGMSPLHYLFWKNCPTDDFRLREAARFLKSSGCLVDLRDRIGETVFHVACLRKNPLSAFRVLKDLGANLHMKTAKQESALHLVAASCDPVFLVSAFQFLIDEGVEVSARDDADKTALYYISERKKIDPELRSQIIGLIRPVAAHHHFAGSDVNSDTDSLLSPQTSSDLGFSEKLSLDDLPGTPESGSAFRHFAVPCVSSRHSRSHSSTSTNSARFSPYEPRRPPRQHRSSTQDLYSLSTSSYSPGGVTSPVHAFVPIHPHSPLTHQPMPAQTTLPTPIPSTSRAPSNISNIASSSKSNNALALTNALHPPPPPPTPQHAQHDAQTSTDDITQASRCLPMSPVTIMPGAVHREPMSPRCRLWRMGELENALPRTVSDSGHIVVSPNPSGICPCNRCQRESLDRSRLEELERTVQNLTRQNADMRQQFDDLQQKNQSIRQRAQRIETCEICSFPYSENEEASNRCTFRKCGHICCAECVQQMISLAQSGENNEPPRCPFHSCRTPFTPDDVVTLKL